MELPRTDLQKDLDAAVQTRKELGRVGPSSPKAGEEGESEIIDSFLSRIDSRLDARVERRVAERLAEYGPPPRHPGRDRGFAPKMPVLSLVMGIPLSGIGAGTGGLTGLLVVWAGIVGVNVATSFGELRARREEREAVRRRRDGWE